MMMREAVRFADVVGHAVDTSLWHTAKCDSTVLVLWKPPVVTYSSAELFTVACPANSSPIFG